MPPSSHPVVCFGEVLWDILPSGPLPGGAPMNVAFHLKKLGLEPAIISKVGSDDYGKNLLEILRQNGLVTEYISVDEQQPTGLVYANVKDGNEVVYDIVKPSAWDFIGWTKEYENLVQQSRFFVFGSLSSRHTPSRETLEKLLDIAGTKVCDINLRPPHFDQAQVEYLLQQADILKMNSHELHLITNWFDQSETSMEGIRFLQERFDIETLIVTRGGEGAVINHKGKVYEHPGYRVKVADTIGSGDAFLAGFLSMILKDAAMETALNFACAMGAFVATQPGACPSYTTSEIMEMIGTDHMKNPDTQIIPSPKHN